MAKTNVKVKLTGTDGNAFAVIGNVSAAMRKAKVPTEQVAEFKNAAMRSKSYDALLVLCMEWVEVS